MMGHHQGTVAAAMLIVLIVLLLAPVHCHRALRGEPAAPATAEAGPTDLVPADAVISSWTDTLLSGYLSNDQLAAWSLDFSTRCARIARRFSIGKSVQGADLWVVEIAANPGKVEAKPNFKYVANMHGDEPGGRMLLPMLAEWLCKQQGSDPRADRIINGMHLFLMPTMNPDGFAKRRRYNAVGADLNRDFPSPFLAPGCKGQAPEACDPALLSLVANSRVQPETAAIMTWTGNKDWPFTAAANLHEGAIVANYPWDGYLDGSKDTKGINNPTTEERTYEYLAESYSKAHPSMGRSAMFDNGITNGAGWYPIYGSMQDYDVTAGGCMEITLELSQDKYPPASTLARQWADNLNPLLALPITAVLGGVSGQVTDSAGAPIKGAVVMIDGVSSKVATRGPLSYYNRPLAPGSWTLRVQAPGFRAVSAVVTVPADGQGVRQDFKLVRARRVPGRPAAIVERDETVLRVG